MVHRRACEPYAHPSKTLRFSVTILRPVRLDLVDSSYASGLEATALNETWRQGLRTARAPHRGKGAVAQKAHNLLCIFLRRGIVCSCNRVANYPGVLVSRCSLWALCSVLGVGYETKRNYPESVGTCRGLD